MSSPSFSATIDLRLQPSLRAVQVALALHLAAIALAFLAAPPKGAGLVLSLAILVSWWRLRRPAAAGYGRGAIAHLLWHGEDGRWQVGTADGRSEAATLLGSSVVWPRLVVLNFRLDSGRRATRVLLGDETDAESLRRLRARLLMRVSTPSA